MIGFAIGFIVYGAFSTYQAHVLREMVEENQRMLEEAQKILDEYKCL